jgi:hypothetical protein
MLSAMTPAYEIGFYQSILPLATDIVFFDDVPFSEPSNYAYDVQACGRCLPVCTIPYSSAPSHDYWNTGSDIYLLDPYPTSALVDRLFNSPTDPSSPGLGVLKHQLFLGLRGWDIHQVKPVNWPEGLQGCDAGAIPAMLRGQAQRVGEPRNSALVIINTSLAGTGPIDLSAATLFLRQVLTEADGAGEIVRGEGGAPFLPVLLAAGRGSKPNRATFKTEAGVRPIVTIEVTNRDRANGRLDFALTVNLASAPEAPDTCGDGSALLRTRLILDDHLHPPVAVNLEQPWRCNRSRLTAP